MIRRSWARVGLINTGPRVAAGFSLNPSTIRLENVRYDIKKKIKKPPHHHTKSSL